MTHRHISVPIVAAVKHVFFACSIFHEVCNLGDVTKITGLEYSKSHAVSMVLTHPGKSWNLRKEFSGPGKP